MTDDDSFRRRRRSGRVLNECRCIGCRLSVVPVRANGFIVRVGRQPSKVRQFRRSIHEIRISQSTIDHACGAEHGIRSRVSRHGT